MKDVRKIWKTGVRYAAVLVKGESTAILRETGALANVRKMLRHSEPAGYQQSKPRTKKKLEAYVGGLSRFSRRIRRCRVNTRTRLNGSGSDCRRGIHWRLHGHQSTVRELTAHQQEVFVRWSTARRGAGGFWRSAGEPEWKVTEGAFFGDALPYSDGSL